MYFVAKLGPALQGFLSIFLITKSLAPESYGKYSLALTLILLVTQLLGSWLNQAQFYFLPKRRSRLDGMVAWFSVTNLYIGLAGSLVVVISLQMLQVGMDVAVVGGAVFFAQIYWNFISTYYQAFEQPKVQLIASTCQVAVQVTVISALFYFRCISAASALLAVLAGFSAGLLSYQKKSPGIIGSITLLRRENFFRYLKLAISYGGPFSLWFLFCQIYTFSDRFFLSSAGFAADVGRYSAARDLLLGIASMLAMPLLMVAHPMIIRIWTERKAALEIEQIINRNLTIILVIGVLFCTVLLGYGGKIFSTLFSSRYQLRDFEYAMIGCAIFFSVASMYAHKAMEVTGRTMSMAMLGAAVAGFSILGNLVALAFFGLTFVILISLLSQIAYFFGAAWMSRKLWRVFVCRGRVFAIIIVAILVYSVGKLFDAYFPEPMCKLLPLPWGCLAAVSLSIISALFFPEVNSMFRRQEIFQNVASV
jgi:O-antigen/teichoic acid export membrane protein